jgi:hypothetical protein
LTTPQSNIVPISGGNDEWSSRRLGSI